MEEVKIVNPEIIAEGVRFKDLERVRSQQTLVKILRDHEYYFQPINKYESYLFNCVVRTKSQNMTPNFVKKVLKFLKFNLVHDYYDSPLAYTIFTCHTAECINEPIVFTREDVLSIIADVPENYIGATII